MKKALKFAMWTAIALLSTPVLIYLIWLTGNLKDDALDPELAALLARTPSQIDEKNNAYFDTLALSIPENMEPHAWGVSWFAQVSANDQAALAGRHVNPVKIEAYPDKSAQVAQFCAKPESSCLNEVAANKNGAQQYLDQNAFILQRYDALPGKDYQEPYRKLSAWSTFAPRAQQVRAAKLALTRIALEISQGNDEMALSRWQKETAFLRLQAKNSYSLIDKMVVDSLLVRYQRVLADYLSTRPAQLNAPQIQAMLAPFTREALSLQPAFENEAIQVARTFINLTPENATEIGQTEEADISAQWILQLLSPFLDRNATANMIAANNLEWARIATLKDAAYRTALASKPMSDPSFKLSYHNPAGTYLANISEPDFTTYLYKNDLVIANSRLLALASDLIARDITSSEQIAQEIIDRRDQLKHPFTGEAPVWDKNARTLSYPVPQRFSGQKPLTIRL